MKEINLRELYPDIYSADIFVEVMTKYGLQFRQVNG